MFALLSASVRSSETKCESGKDKFRRPRLLKLLPFLIAPNHMQGGHDKAAAGKESSQACTYVVDTCNINVAYMTAKHHLFIQIDRMRFPLRDDELPLGHP